MWARLDFFQMKLRCIQPEIKETKGKERKRGKVEKKEAKKKRKSKKEKVRKNCPVHNCSANVNSDHLQVSMLSNEISSLVFSEHATVYTLAKPGRTGPRYE